MFATILKAIALVTGAVIVFVIFAAVWVYALVAILVMAALFGAMWLLNARFNVTQNGVKVGTYTRKGGFRRI
jgi:hypothetical protein